MRKINNSIDRFCILHPGFGIPRLAFYIVVCNIAVYLLNSFSRGTFSQLLYFSPHSVLRGQIWRLVTFALIPTNSGLLSMILSCYCTYWIGMSLEQRWGTAKFTCYYLCGIALNVLGACLVSLLLGVDYTLYGVSSLASTMFLAFALFWPDAQLILIPIPIPIKARWLIYFYLALFALEIVPPLLSGSWYAVVLPLAALLNLCFFSWPEVCRFLRIEEPRVRGQAERFRDAASTQWQNRRPFRTQGPRMQYRSPQSQQRQSGDRVCAVCGRSNRSNPELQFRYCSQCAGYHCFCSDHIFSHVHFTEDSP